MHRGEARDRGTMVGVLRCLDGDQRAARAWQQALATWDNKLYALEASCARRDVPRDHFVRQAEQATHALLQIRRARPQSAAADNLLGHLVFRRAQGKVPTPLMRALAVDPSLSYAKHQALGVALASAYLTGQRYDPLYVAHLGRLLHGRYRKAPEPVANARAWQILLETYNPTGFFLDNLFALGAAYEVAQTEGDEALRQQCTTLAEQTWRALGVGAKSERTRALRAIQEAICRHDASQNEAEVLLALMAPDDTALQVAPEAYLPARRQLQLRLINQKADTLDGLAEHLAAIERQTQAQAYEAALEAVGQARWFAARHFASPRTQKLLVALLGRCLRQVCRQGLQHGFRHDHARARALARQTMALSQRCALDVPPELLVPSLFAPSTLFAPPSDEQSRSRQSLANRSRPRFPGAAAEGRASSASSTLTITNDKARGDLASLAGAEATPSGVATRPLLLRSQLPPRKSSLAGTTIWRGSQMGAASAGQDSPTPTFVRPRAPEATSWRISSGSGSASGGASGNGTDSANGKASAPLPPPIVGGAVGLGPAKQTRAVATAAAPAPEVSARTSTTTERAALPLQAFVQTQGPEEQLREEVMFALVHLHPAMQGATDATRAENAENAERAERAEIAQTAKSTKSQHSPADPIDQALIEALFAQDVTGPMTRDEVFRAQALYLCFVREPQAAAACRRLLANLARGDVLALPGDFDLLRGYASSNRLSETTPRYRPSRALLATVVHRLRHGPSFSALCAEVDVGWSTFDVPKLRALHNFVRKLCPARGPAPWAKGAPALQAFSCWEARWDRLQLAAAALHQAEANPKRAIYYAGARAVLRRYLSLEGPATDFVSTCRDIAQAVHWQLGHHPFSASLSQQLEAVLEQNQALQEQAMEVDLAGSHPQRFTLARASTQLLQNYLRALHDSLRAAEERVENMPLAGLYHVVDNPLLDELDAVGRLQTLDEELTALRRDPRAI